MARTPKAPKTNQVITLKIKKGSIINSVYPDNFLKVGITCTLATDIAVQATGRYGIYQFTYDGKKWTTDYGNVEVVLPE